ncbi:MAG: hypothetical protein J6T17_02115, partial [Clostridia bacterium]|nr:hypothetical protein [Clostridia bacterium]
MNGWDYEISSEPFTDIAKTPTSVKTDIGKNRISENDTLYKESIVDKESKYIYPPIPPTHAEVAAYCRQQGFADPEGFADYYLRCQTEMGWVKKNGLPVTNWKLNVQQWRRYHKDETFPLGTAMPVQATADELKAFMR